jgi:hypothetical protein
VTVPLAERDGGAEAAGIGQRAGIDDQIAWCDGVGCQGPGGACIDVDLGKVDDLRAEACQGARAGT